MKVVCFVLAFLLIVFALVPYMLTICDNDKTDSSDVIISLYNKKKDKIENVGLEKYLVYVVSAEMPSSFSPEALKAQAVAARTYALKKINKNLPEHKKADLCTDFAHCQAYSDDEELKGKWGKSYDANIKKVKQAVEQTKGEYLSYNGDYAITVFHSCSNGFTEKASEVWGGDYSYLKSVESPGDYEKKDYITKNKFTESEFKKIIKDHFPEADFSKAAIGDICYTSGSNIKNICVYGQKISGNDMRKIFSLKSSAFSLDMKNNSFVFTVAGNGHGVGMSQYGAEKMAQNGKKYSDILYHYYPGTKLLK